MKIGERIRFLIALTFILVQAPFFIAILFYASLFPAGSGMAMRTRATFATLSAAMWIPFLGLRVSTQLSSALKSPPKPNHVRMFLCTHQSFSDALTVALLFWMYRRWLGPGVALYKKELGSIPIMGQLQRFSGNIPVSRSGDTEAAKRAMGIAAQRVREGYHVSGFPEGSRRRTPSTGEDQTQPLKKGFFHLVKTLCDAKTVVDIHPVVFAGSYRSWPIGRSIPIAGSKVSVRVGDAVTVSGQVDVDEMHSRFTRGIADEIDQLAPTYNAEIAFKKGYEIDFLSLFGFETVLSVIPVLGVFFSQVFFSHS